MLIKIKLSQENVIFIYTVPSHKISVSIRSTSIVNSNHSTVLVAIFRLTSKLLPVQKAPDRTGTSNDYRTCRFGYARGQPQRAIQSPSKLQNTPLLGPEMVCYSHRFHRSRVYFDTSQLPDININMFQNGTVACIHIECVLVHSSLAGTRRQGYRGLAFQKEMTEGLQQRHNPTSDSSFFGSKGSEAWIIFILHAKTWTSSIKFQQDSRRVAPPRFL